MVAEIRERLGGPAALSRALSSGGASLAAQAMGAGFAYIGSAFIATHEARAVEGQKKVITERNSDEIVYSNLYTGIHRNDLKGSIRHAVSDPSKMNFTSGEGASADMAWKNIQGCGQGIGAIREVMAGAEMVARFKREYAEARVDLCAA